MTRFSLFLIVLILLATGGMLLLLENPEQFKPQITDTVTDASGYVVNIDGELSWRYWPPLAIQLNEVSLATAEDQAPFATFDHVEVDVDLLPLLTLQQLLEVSLVSIEGGELNLLVNDAGQDNWTLTEPATRPADSADVESESASQVDPSIELISFKDLSVTYRDLESNLDYAIIVDSLTTTSISAGTPFDLQVTANLTDKVADLDSSLELSSQLLLAANNERLSFTDMQLSASIQSPDLNLENVKITSHGEWLTDNQILAIKSAKIDINQLQAEIAGAAHLSGASPFVEGQLKLSSTALDQFGSAFDLELPVKNLSMQGDFVASADRVRLDQLQGTLDDSEFTGTVTTSLETPMRSEVDLRIDQVDLDRLTASSADSNTVSASGAVTQSADSELIPVDTLKDVYLNSTVRIGKLIASGYELEDAKIDLNTDDDELSLIANAKGMDGKFVATIDTDLTLRQPLSVITLSLDGLNIQKLIELEAVTGQLSGTSKLTFEGAMLSDLNQSLKGRSTFTVADGSMDVRPIKQLANTIDILRGKRSSVSDWPDVMPFERMAGEHVISNGLTSGQVLNANVENLQLTALGGMDLVAETLDYRVSAMFRSASEGQFKVSDQLAGIRWPLTCQGSFSESPSDLCFGQEGAISNLVTDIIKQDLERRGRNKLEELIDEKAPAEYKDLLKSLFDR